MNKSIFKKEKDKLLVSKNTTISRIRANDEGLINELRNFTGLVKIKDLVKAVEDRYKASLKELQEKLNASLAEKEAIKSLSVDPIKPPTPPPAAPRKHHVTKADVAPQYTRPERIAELKISQRKAANSTLEAIQEERSMTLLRGGTGTGKTFVAGDVIQQLHDMGWFKTKWPTFYPCLVVTPAAVVPQYRKVLEYYFGLKHKKEFFVTNYEQLRTSYGERYIDKVKIADEDGNVDYEYNWHPALNPPLIIWDEYHKLKNETSTQHKIAMALNKLPDEFKTIQVGFSATPWSRVADCKHFGVTNGLKI